LHLPVTTDVLLLYPGVSLQDQIGLWAMRHPQQHLETSLAWSPDDLRVLLRHAGIVVVDATENPGRAREVFLRAVSHLGANAVVMYTETMHDALEVFVRLRGSLFVLGPLFDEQWEEYFSRLLRTEQVAPIAPITARQRPRFARSLDRAERQRAWLINRFRGSLDRPMTDMN
jgi:hypothetical protein